MLCIYAEYHYSQLHISLIAMLNVLKLSVVAPFWQSVETSGCSGLKDFSISFHFFLIVIKNFFASFIYLKQMQMQ